MQSYLRVMVAVFSAFVTEFYLYLYLSGKAAEIEFLLNNETVVAFKLICFVFVHVFVFSFMSVFVLKFPYLYLIGEAEENEFLLNNETVVAFKQSKVVSIIHLYQTEAPHHTIIRTETSDCFQIK